MMRHRGLSTVVGAVFFVIAAASTITYISYSMDMIDTFANTVMVKQTEQEQRINEKFEITRIRIDNAKFNLTVTNTGDVPINIKRMWVENRTATDWVYKFDINQGISPGDQVYNIGQNLALTAKDTIPYTVKLITERGSVVQILLNSLSQERVFMQLTPTPSNVPTGFFTTLQYQIVNNMTGGDILLNLTPQITASGNALATLQSGPTPASYPSLDKGEIATFMWVYQMDGDDGDFTTFNATVANAASGNFVTAQSTVKLVEEAGNSQEAVEAGTADVSVQLGTGQTSDDIIIFHQETDLVPSGKYQMFSGDPDGGSTGTVIPIDQQSPNFFTANASDTITIPQGDWVASLSLRSEPMPASLLNEGEDMIFHFEDGIGANPDNSEGDSDRDLQGCGSTPLSIMVTANSDDAREETGAGGQGDPGKMDTGQSKFYLPYDGTKENINAMRFKNVQIPVGSTIASAYVQFTAQQTSSSTVTLKIYGQDIDDAPTFTSSNYDISTRTKTGNFTTWAVASWTNNDRTVSQQTPSISSIIQEIVNRPGWASGNDIVIIIENDGTSSGLNRQADTRDGSSSNAPELVLVYAPSQSSQTPDFQGGSGPHGSGAYSFNGVNQCFRSVNFVSSSNGNYLYAEPDTTALWFKTNGQVTSEQYLVNWDEEDYYRIYLDSTGKIVFKFSTNLSNDVTTCQSTKEYDDSQWYHVVAVRTDTPSDACTLYIADLSGSNPKSESVYPISQDNSYSTAYVNIANARWYVGSDENESGKWFKGWIDDVIHWDGKALSSTEALDLSEVNYGTGAHKLDIYLDLTDEHGNLVQNLVTGLGVNVPFQDPKSLPTTNDLAYSQFNYTMSMNQLLLSSPNRLNFSMFYVPSTSNWETLDLDMLIDDENLVYPSYIQVPYPSQTLPGYFIYDPGNDELDISYTNVGSKGHWISYYLTRAVLKSSTNATSSYAAPIDRVDGQKVDNMADSIFIAVNQTSTLEFFPPKNPPDPSNGCGPCAVDGPYKMTIYIQGYDDLGQMFIYTKYIGLVNVIN